MKAVAKMGVFAVLCGGVLFGVASQVIDVSGNTVNIRTNNTAENATNHYGDLWVSGGGASKPSLWGWVGCNRLRIYGSNEYPNEIRANLILYNDLNVYGSKNFIHPHPTDTNKLIRYISAESGEALTIARGNSRTVNGEVCIKLPEHFSLVTSGSEPVSVIVTPKGAPVLLYIKEESKSQIVVAMKKSDFTEFHDVAFAYQVTGVRDGFVGQEVIVDAEKLDMSTAGQTLEGNDVQKRIKAFTQRMEKRMEKVLEEKGRQEVKGK